MAFNPNDFFDAGPARVGLLAVYGEVSALLKLMQVEGDETVAQARFYRGRLAGRSVIVAAMGQAKVHAASAAQILVDRCGATLLLSCGTAGAIAPQRQVGDVVLANRVVPHDNGWQAGAGFVPLGVYNSALPDGRHYRRDWPADPALLDAAQRVVLAAKWPESPPTVITGTLVSGEQVIASAEKKRWLHQTFAAEAVDMETAAVAQVAALNGIGWLAVRAISDTADSALDVDITQLITYDETPDTLVEKVQRTAKSLSQLAGNPRQAEALVRLRKGLKLAALHAALAAEAVVGGLP